MNEMKFIRNVLFVLISIFICIMVIPVIVCNFQAGLIEDALFGIIGLILIIGVVFTALKSIIC